MLLKQSDLQALDALSQLSKPTLDLVDPIPKRLTESRVLHGYKNTA